jgi:hypothetical protein
VRLSQICAEEIVQSIDEIANCDYV